MEIKKENLSWRTRGFDWDYEFIIKPSPEKIPNLYGLHTDIFGKITPTTEPKTFSRSRKESSNYIVATCFLMDDMLDEFYRPIKHFFMYVVDSESDVSNFENKKEWGKELLGSLRNQYPDYFQSPPQQLF